MYAYSVNNANIIVPVKKITTFTYFLLLAILNIPMYTHTCGSYIVEICTTHKYGKPPKKPPEVWKKRVLFSLYVTCECGGSMIKTIVRLVTGMVRIT